jgi:hypothetical protein
VELVDLLNTPAEIESSVSFREKPIESEPAAVYDTGHLQELDLPRGP